ncbi:tenascin-like, partial [Aphis craccivora]
MRKGSKDCIISDVDLVCTTIEYKSHSDYDYDITTICKTSPLNNTENPFNTASGFRCYDIKIHLRTNAIGMPIKFNGLILSSEKKSLEFIADAMYPELFNNIFTQNQIEYNTTDWTISTLSMSNDKAEAPEEFSYNLLLWKANTTAESFKIKWKQRNSIKMCISISYLLEDESQCTFNLDITRDDIVDKKIISSYNIKKSKELTTVLFKSDYWLHENETYSLNFKLQRKSSEIRTRKYERYYNYDYGYDQYYYKTVYAENCKIGIKRISQCTDDNGNEHEEILTINAKELQDMPSDTSLTADVFPFEYKPQQKSISLISQCLNGGFANKTGCTCPPGFKGENCEHGCGPNTFGADCTGICSMYQTQCQQLMFCTKGFGCKCPAGYNGKECNKGIKKKMYI